MITNNIASAVTINPNGYTGTTGTVTNYTNAYNGSDNTSSYATFSATTSSRSAATYFTFDTSSIPSDATINSVTGTVRYNVNNTSYLSPTVQLYNGTTAKGSAITNASTSSAIYTLDCGTWTREEIDNLKLYVRALCTRTSNNRGYTLYFYGAEITINYTYNEIVYEITTSIEKGTLISPTTATMTANNGDNVTLYFSGDTGQPFKSLTVNGADATTPSLVSKKTYGDVLTTSSTTYTVSTNYSTYSSYALSNAYDGDDNSKFWSSEAQATGKYVLITFANRIHLNSFSTYSESSSDYPKTCNVLQVSSDGSTWEDVGTFQASQTSTFSNIDKDCQYVRIYATSDISNWLVINEITMDYNDIEYNEVYCYAYTISSISSDTNVVIEFGKEYPIIYVKTADGWKTASKIYQRTKDGWATVKGTAFQASATNGTYRFMLGEYTGVTLVGTVAKGTNIISLDSSALGSGTYTLYYEDSNNTPIDGWNAIGTITI